MAEHPEHPASAPVLTGDDADRPARSGPAVWLAAGGVIAALMASSCCIVPLALFAVGVSGAWIGQLSALTPYQPLFLAATAACLGYGFWLVYGRPAAACADPETCARPLPRRGVKMALWTGSLLAATAFAFPYAAPVLLGV